MMQQEILTFAYLFVVSIALLIGYFVYDDNKHFTTTHFTISIYLITQLVYLFNTDVIINFNDIDNDYKYYGFINNSLIIVDPDVFYMTLLGIYGLSIIIESTISSRKLFIMWCCVNFFDQFIAWLFYRNLKKIIGFYIISHHDGMIAISTCYVSFSLLHALINNIDGKMWIILWSTLLLFIFNIINIVIYDEIYNPLNVNIGYLMGIIFAIAYL